MKQDLHPQYFETKIHCACGQAWVGGGTIPELSLDICSNCHPFYTGKQKTLDTAGRIDKFTKRMALGEKAKEASEAKKQAKKEEVVAE